LRDQFHIKTFTYGGASGETFQPTSFEGGAVKDFGGLYEASVSLGGLESGIQGAPLPFTFPASGSIAFWEAYSTLGGQPVFPAEWVRMVADGHVFVNDPLDVLEIWNRTAEMAFGNQMSKSRLNSDLVDSGSARSKGWRLIFMGLLCLVASLLL
jgi:hypothetical protein